MNPNTGTPTELAILIDAVGRADPTPAQECYQVQRRTGGWRNPKVVATCGHTHHLESAYECAEYCVDMGETNVYVQPIPEPGPTERKAKGFRRIDYGNQEPLIAVKGE